MKWAIYKHTCKANNLVYIGITKQEPPEKRWMNGSGYKGNVYFYYYIRKYGWDKGFKHEIIVSDIESFEEARDLEQKIINQFLSDENYLQRIKEKRFGLNIFNQHIE